MEDFTSVFGMGTGVSPPLWSPVSMLLGFNLIKGMKVNVSLFISEEQFGFMVGVHDDSGPLKKFMDKSVLFDLFVLGVLGLDAYLLQQSGTFSTSGITQVPPPSIEILAAQLTAVLIVAKIVNAIVDESS